MSISNQDLMDYADNFWKQANCENGHRTAVSKFYYAAYHLCNLEFSSQLNFPKNTDGGVHQKLWGALKEFEDPADQERQRFFRTIGNLGDSLRIRRVDADYKLNKNIGSNESRLTRCGVRRIFEEVKNFEKT